MTSKNVTKVTTSLWYAISCTRLRPDGIYLFSQIDEQRKYLGGDSEHSVLVKGLDLALLEQNKAKAAATSAVEDEEALEQAFLGVDVGTSADDVESATQPKKSRQDLIRELKEKRGQNMSAEKNATNAGIEEAKKAGKFKPIGFKPVGGDSEGKKRKKEKEGGEKKKKRKVVEGKPTEVSDSTQHSAPPLPSTLPEKEGQPEPEPLDPDFDIFAGVEEYVGEIEGDSVDEDRSGEEDLQEPQQDNRPKNGGWLDEPKSPIPPPKEPMPSPAKEYSEGKAEEVEEEPAPMRLVPLASSFSVKDILAIDDAVSKEEKRKARKEKKKKKAELDAEGKANRDYQKCVLSLLVLWVEDIHLGCVG